MNTRRCVAPAIGLLLLLGAAPARAADADQEAAIAAIQKVGGNVSGNPPSTVTLVGRKSANAGMLYVDRLPGLTGIYAGDSDVADDGLVKVKGLTGLTYLYLKNTRITDKGLANLKGLTKLRSIDLEGTDIGDDGIAHLQGLPELNILNLSGTKVTDAGVAKLRKTLPKILEIRRAAPTAGPKSTDSAAPAQTDAGKSTDQIKLPIPGFDVPCNVSLWNGSFTVKKMTHDRENNQIVFVLEAVRNFTFQDDGFESIKFYDEDGVDMIKKKNVQFDPVPRTLKRGEATRARMDVPDEKILQQTRKCTAVASGFFKK
jgi:hypothetical protein